MLVFRAATIALQLVFSLFAAAHSHFRNSPPVRQALVLQQYKTGTQLYGPMSAPNQRTTYNKEDA